MEVKKDNLGARNYKNDPQEDKLVVKKMFYLAITILLLELLLVLISIYIGSMYPYFKGAEITGLIK